MLEGSEGGTQSAAGDITDADGTSGRRPLQEGATRFVDGERSAIEVIGRIAENAEFGIRNSESGSAKKIQKLGKVVMVGDNSHLNSAKKNGIINAIINNNEQNANSNIEKESEVYVAREETRDEFNRAAHEEGYTVGERGKIAYAYKVCRAHSKNGQKLSQELKKLGIKGIIHEGLKSNCNGITITYDAGASTFAGYLLIIRLKEMPLKQ